MVAQYTRFRARLPNYPLLVPESTRGIFLVLISPRRGRHLRCRRFTTSAPPVGLSADDGPAHVWSRDGDEIDRPLANSLEVFTTRLTLKSNLASSNNTKTFDTRSVWLLGQILMICRIGMYAKFPPEAFASWASKYIIPCRPSHQDQKFLRPYV